MSTWKSTLDDAQRAFVRRWWQALQPRKPDDPILPRELAEYDRGTRAALRRGANANELLMESSVHLLAQRLLALDTQRPKRRFPEEDEGVALAHVWIALVAGVLAHVRDDPPDDRNGSLAWRLGRAAGDPPLMSELRFKRLLKAKGEPDLLRQWRRAVALADGKADVAQLADDLLSWQVEQSFPPTRASDGIRFRWAYDYYLTKPKQTAAKAPASIEELSE